VIPLRGCGGDQVLIASAPMLPPHRTCYHPRTTTSGSVGSLSNIVTSPRARPPVRQNRVQRSTRPGGHPGRRHQLRDGQSHQTLSACRYRYVFHHETDSDISTSGTYSAQLLFDG